MRSRPATQMGAVWRFFPHFVGKNVLFACHAAVASVGRICNANDLSMLACGRITRAWVA